ncbi:MAG: polysaccharide biosynthesis tyrosine autokinase [Phycisphaerae bacterium]|nr:polysaccharide biosynthesis tyrosine autokinase [Phycisphaerae bacterium]
MTRHIPLPAEAQNRMARPNPATAGQSTITFKDIKRIILSRMLLIFLITTFMTAASVGLWYYLKLHYPRFESVGSIVCKMPAVPGMGNIMERTDILEMETHTQANAMNNKGFLTSVLEDINVQNTQWFQKRKLDKRMKDIEDHFRASPVRTTKLVRISMQAETPEEAKIIVDAARAVFQREKQKEATDHLNAQYEAINNELDKTIALVKATRTELEILGSDADIKAAGWMSGQTTIQSQMIIMAREKLHQQALLSETEAGLSQLQESQRLLGYSITVQQAVENDSLIMSFNNQITELDQLEKQLLERSGPEHREVKDIRNRKETAEKQLEERRNELLDRYSKQQIQGLELQVESLKDQLNKVSEELKSLNFKQENLDKKKREYENKKIDLDELILRKNKQNEEIRAIQQLLNDPSRLRVTFLPEGQGTRPLPSDISFPKLGIFLPAGIILGLMLSIGLAFLLEFVDDSIKSPAEVMRYLRVPMLGMIPEHDPSDARGVCIEKIASTQSHALISEYYRQMKTNLLFSGPSGELKTILVTSSSAGCGKTTTASNLGITFAAAGKRVLLVDANFRRPALSRLYPSPEANQGLSNLLVGQVQASEAIYASGIANMDVIQSGPLPPNPSDLLNSQRMRDFLDGQRQKYDYVIIDGPPALVVIDSRVISSLVDGTVVVVNANQNSRGMVQRMNRELKTESGKILGILLNSVKSRKGGYFAKTSQSYYDYIGEEASAMTALPATRENGKEPPR